MPETEMNYTCSAPHLNEPALGVIVMYEICVICVICGFKSLLR